MNVRIFFTTQAILTQDFQYTTPSLCTEKLDNVQSFLLFCIRLFIASSVKSGRVKQAKFKTLLAVSLGMGKIWTTKHLNFFNENIFITIICFTDYSFIYRMSHFIMQIYIQFYAFKPDETIGKLHILYQLFYCFDNCVIFSI